MAPKSANNLAYEKDGMRLGDKVGAKMRGRMFIRSMMLPKVYLRLRLYSSGYTASKHVPLWELLWFLIVANMSITGMNLSLMLNSVGFYQMQDECEHLIKITVTTLWEIIQFDSSFFLREQNPRSTKDPTLL
ncbi:hypothetical protein Tco_0035343, partial [Tanacetum coccineum]